MKKFFSIAASLLLIVSLGCQEEPTAGDKIRDVGDAVGDAVQDVGDGVGDAATDIKDNIDDTIEE